MKNYNTVDFYFIKEYQWKDNWYSKEGVCRVKVSASHEFLQNNPYVDYSIFGDWFVLTNKMRNCESAIKVFQDIKKALKNNDSYYLGNENSGIEIDIEKTTAYDNLGSEDGMEAPICWNIKTPKKYQSIPTEEMLRIIETWIIFLDEQTQIELKEKSI